MLTSDEQTDFVLATSNSAQSIEIACDDYTELNIYASMNS